MSQPDPGAARGCYCILWEKAPHVLERQGVPRGFCGLCETCGAPGHLRRFPGAVPYTGAWCDWHHRRIALTDPRAPVGCLVWLVVLALAGAAVFALLR